MSGPFIEWTLTLGNIIQIAVIAGGGLLVLVMMRMDVGRLKDDIRDIQTEIKKMGDVLVALARTEERLTNQRREIDELRRDINNIRKNA